MQIVEIGLKGLQIPDDNFSYIAPAVSNALLQIIEGQDDVSNSGMYRPTPWRLTQDRIISLAKLHPNSEHVRQLNAMLKKNDGLPPPNIARTDSFYLSLMAIPNLEQILRCILIELSFRHDDDFLSDKLARLSLILDALDSELRAKGSLTAILALIVKVGNYVNFRTRKAPVYGLQLSALESLKNIKTSNPQVSFLRVIAEHIDQQLPYTWADILWLPSLTEVADSDPEDLRHRLTEVKTGLRTIENAMKDQSLLTAHPLFKPAFGPFLEAAKQRVDVLGPELNRIADLTVKLASSFEDTPTGVREAVVLLKRLGQFGKDLLGMQRQLDKERLTDDRRRRQREGASAGTPSSRRAGVSPPLPLTPRTASRRSMVGARPSAPATPTKPDVTPGASNRPSTEPQDPARESLSTPPPLSVPPGGRGQPSAAMKPTGLGMGASGSSSSMNSMLNSSASQNHRYDGSNELPPSPEGESSSSRPATTSDEDDDCSVGEEVSASSIPSSVAISEAPTLGSSSRMGRAPTFTPHYPRAVEDHALASRAAAGVVSTTAAAPPRDQREPHTNRRHMHRRHPGDYYQLQPTELPDAGYGADSPAPPFLAPPSGGLYAPPDFISSRRTPTNSSGGRVCQQPAPPPPPQSDYGRQQQMLQHQQQLLQQQQHQYQYFAEQQYLAAEQQYLAAQQCGVTRSSNGTGGGGWAQAPSAFAFGSSAHLHGREGSSNQGLQYGGYGGYEQPQVADIAAVSSRYRQQTPSAQPNGYITQTNSVYQQQQLIGVGSSVPSVTTQGGGEYRHQQNGHLLHQQTTPTHRTRATHGSQTPPNRLHHMALRPGSYFNDEYSARRNLPNPAPSAEFLHSVPTPSRRNAPQHHWR